MATPPVEDDATNTDGNTAVIDQTSTGQEEAQQVADTSTGNAEEDQTANSEQNTNAEEVKPRGERRHERYIDKLSAEIRLGTEQSGRYDDSLFAPTPKKYEPLTFKEGEEYDPKQLEEDRQKVADNSRSEGREQGYRQGTTRATLENFETKLDIDKDRVAAKWDSLDPDAEGYNPKLEQYLVTQYIAFAGVEKDAKGNISITRPNIRFRDFVDAEMQNMEDYASTRNQQSTNNVRQQAARTGVRPGGQTRATKETHGFDPNDAAGSVSRMSKKQYFDLGGKEASDAYLAKRGLA